MNIRNINIFLTLFRTRSATSTAVLSGVSQPAVSQIVKQMERELGIKLFVLMNGRLTPTPEAEQIAQDMTEVSSSYARMCSLVDNLRDGGQGLLKIATLTWSTFLPETVRRFQEVAPNAKVEMHTMRASKVVETVSKGEADIGIVTNFSDPQLCHYKDLRGMDVVAAIPLGNHLEKLAVVTPANLRGERLMCYDLETPFGEQAAHAFASVGERFDVSVQVASSTLLCALVEQGAGVALLEPFIALGPQRYRMCIKPFNPKIPVTLRLVLPPNRPLSVLAQHFQRLLEANFRGIVARNTVSNRPAPH